MFIQIFFLNRSQLAVKVYKKGPGMKKESSTSANHSKLKIWREGLQQVSTYYNPGTNTININSYQYGFDYSSGILNGESIQLQLQRHHSQTIATSCSHSNIISSKYIYPTIVAGSLYLIDSYLNLHLAENGSFRCMCQLLHAYLY